MGVKHNPIDVEPKHLKVLLGLLQSHLPSVAVWAFGSRVKWTSRPDSDLDLVVFAKSEQNAQVHALKEALEESNLPFRVDVLVWDAISEAFRDNIRKEYVELVGCEWITGKLGEFIELKRGYDLPQAKRLTGDVPLVSSSGVSDLHNVAMVKGPGVVTGRYGTIGQVFYVENDFWPLNTTLYVKDFKGNDRKFIHYFLKTLDFHAYSDKAAVPGVNRNHLHEAIVAIPPISVQREIATILGHLDDRITLLRETNATLEAIAQALFKSWFVDFDPVHAKMEGRTPEGMDDATAALFPDSFEETELGMVPMGWLPRTFRETIDIIGGGTPKTSNPNFWNGTIPWFSVVDAPAASDVFVIDTEKHITEAGLKGSSTKLLPAGTTIISARGTVGRLALTGCPMTMNQSCYGLRGKAGDDYFTFFSTTRLVQQLQQKAHGSVFDTITQETFSGVHLSYPDAEAIAAFDSAVEPLMLRVRENLVQVQTLSTLRDTLLPRLISGQLRLPEVVSFRQSDHLTTCPAQKAKNPDEPTEAVAPTGTPQST